MVLYDSIIICSMCGRRITGPEAVYEVRHRRLCSHCAWITRSRDANRRTDAFATEEILYQSKEGTDTVSQEKEKAPDNPTSAEKSKSWSEIYEGLSEYVIGQEAAKQALTTALFEHQIRMKSTPDEREQLPRANIILCGGTGVGKTELLRAASKILHIPLVIADSTTLTGPGYRGDDIEDYLSDLYNAADKDIAKAQVGILMLDEFDKICLADTDKQIRSYNKLIQQSLLKIVEGKIADVPEIRGEKKSRTVKFDTSGLLIVVAGAHYGIHPEEEQQSFPIGFASDTDRKEIEHKSIHPLGPEDFIRFGYERELIGRMPNIIELSDLDTETMVRIMTEPTHSMLGRYTNFAKKLGCELSFDEAALKLIAEKGQQLHTGARGCISVLEHVLRKTIVQIAKGELTDCIRVTVDDVNSAYELSDER